MGHPLCAMIFIIFATIVFHCSLKYNYPVSVNFGFVKHWHSKNTNVSCSVSNKNCCSENAVDKYNSSFEKYSPKVKEFVLNASDYGLDAQKVCLNNNKNKSGENILLGSVAMVNSTKRVTVAKNTTRKCNLLPKGSLNCLPKDEYHGTPTRRQLQKNSAHITKREAANYDLSSVHFNELIDAFINSAKQVSDKTAFPDVDYPHESAKIQIKDGWIMGVESLERSSNLNILKEETTYIFSFEAQFGDVKFGYRRVEIQLNFWEGYINITVSAKNAKMTVSLILSVLTEGKCRITPRNVTVTQMTGVDMRIGGPTYLRLLLPSLQSSVSHFGDGLIKGTLSKYIQMIMLNASHNFTCKVSGLY